MATGTAAMLSGFLRLSNMKMNIVASASGKKSIQIHISGLRLLARTVALMVLSMAASS